MSLQYYLSIYMFVCWMVKSERVVWRQYIVWGILSLLSTKFFLTGESNTVYIPWNCEFWAELFGLHIFSFRWDQFLAKAHEPLRLSSGISYRKALPPITDTGPRSAVCPGRTSPAGHCNLRSACLLQWVVHSPGQLWTFIFMPPGPGTVHIVDI